MKYDKLQESGNIAGLERLIENSYKNGYDNINPEYAFGKILDRCEDLREEMHFLSLEAPQWHYMRRYSADIRNYCDMIILKCDRELS
jgi:hypothetical protein